MTRWQAGFYHLLISLGVVGTIAMYIVYFWYPPTLFRMAQVGTILLLLGGIDLIIGPTLTTLIYNPQKKRHLIVLDLSVIAICQIVFLAIGLHSLALSRPVFLVASSYSFDLVFANQISPEHQAKASQPIYGHLGWTKPLLVGAKMPQDPKEQRSIIMSALAGNGDLETMPQYYVDYHELTGDLIKHAKPLEALNNQQQVAIATLKQAAVDYGKKPSDVKYMPLNSMRGSATMLIDAKTGEIVGVADVSL